MVFVLDLRGVIVAKMRGISLFSTKVLSLPLVAHVRRTLFLPVVVLTVELLPRRRNMLQLLADCGV